MTSSEQRIDDLQREVDQKHELWIAFRRPEYRAEYEAAEEALRAAVAEDLAGRTPNWEVWS